MTGCVVIDTNIPVSACLGKLYDPLRNLHLIVDIHICGVDIRIHMYREEFYHLIGLQTVYEIFQPFEETLLHVVLKGLFI